MSLTATARRLWANDLVKILATLLAFYAVYILVGFLLDFSLRGQLNALARLTFLIAVYSMLTLALNLHWGYTGLFNIGVAGFMAVALYTMAMVSKPPVSGPESGAAFSGLGLPLPVGIAAGVLAAALLGLLVAIPTRRLRADYLAIVTIATSEIVRFTVLSREFQEFTLAGYELGTGGGRGLILNYPDPMRLVFRTGAYNAFVGAINPMFSGNIRPVTNSLSYAVVLLAFVAGFYWLLMRTGRSPFGRVLKAIREDEDVASALGKNTSLFKIKSFMLGCALMGLGGILWQLRQGAITPGSFRPEITFFIWVALIIGGVGSNTGSILGSIVFVAVLFEGPRFLKNLVSEAFGVPTPPSTIGNALGPLVTDLDPEPFVAYALGNINTLQLVIVGLAIVVLMKRRPQGMLGHRKEIAASIPLAQRGRGGQAEPAVDGGSDE
ncbi:branched-chain amino acid ABC transporter permease [Halobacteriaceae archaeon GCM10025711]